MQRSCLQEHNILGTCIIVLQIFTCTMYDVHVFTLVDPDTETALQCAIERSEYLHVLTLTSVMVWVASLTTAKLPLPITLSNW